jgi:superfamily II DNA or RNA helicase
MNATNIEKMGRKFFEGIGLVICDEVHLLVAETLSRSLQYLCPRYLIGLSATPYRLDGLNILLDLYFGEDKIIREMGLLELDIKSFKYAKYIRSNPDTTNKIYYDNSNIDNSKDGIIESDNNNVMVYLYRNDNPNGINDVIQNNYSKEHPYEKIAYEIAENFYKNNKDKYINI